MSAPLHLVFATRSVPAARELFEPGAEYAAAMRGLSPLAHAGSLPPDLLPHLYAYELVERAREHARSPEPPALLRVPLWPPALFAAAGIEAHSWEELRRLLPPVRCTWIRTEAAAVAAACAEHLPGWRCDAGLYLAELAQAARSEGWEEVRA